MTAIMLPLLGYIGYKQGAVAPNWTLWPLIFISNFKLLLIETINRQSMMKIPVQVPFLWNDFKLFKYPHWDCFQVKWLLPKTDRSFFLISVDSRKWNTGRSINSPPGVLKIIFIMNHYFFWHSLLFSCPVTIHVTLHVLPGICHLRCP